jgi:type I restriction enzyme M protein
VSAYDRLSNSERRIHLWDNVNETTDNLEDAYTIGGGLDPTQIPRLVTPLVLVRWLDQDDGEAPSAKHPARAIPQELQWREWSGGTAQEISHALTALSRLAQPAQTANESGIINVALADSLRRIAHMQQRVLKEAVRWVAALPMKSALDRRNALTRFDQLIVRTAASHDVLRATPPALTGLMAALADAQPGETVLDPYFGRSSLLAAAWRRAQRDSGAAGSSRHPLLEVWGLEINPDAYLVGLTRLLLSGATTAKLFLSDATASGGQTGLPDAFDVILTNPPIGQRPNRIPRFREPPIIAPNQVGDFVEQVLKLLKPRGRAVIAVHDAFLFRGGADRENRRRLVEQGHIQAVVGLPPGIFMPHTSAGGSLLILRKDRRGDQLRMADASPFFEARQGRKQPVLNQVMTQQLAQMVRAPILRTPSALPLQIDPSGLQTGRLSRSVWDVSMRDLAAADWDLTPRRRDKGGLDDALVVLREAIGDKASTTTLGAIVEVIPGRVVALSDLDKSPVGDSQPGYVRIKDLGRGRIRGVTGWIRSPATFDEATRLRRDDVLLSRSGTVGKVALIRDRGVGAVPSAGLYILRPSSNEIDSRFLVAYLSSPVCQQWLAARRRGAAIQTINRDTLAQLPVPLPPLQLQALAANRFESAGADVFESLTRRAGSQSLEQLTPFLTHLIHLVPVSGEGVAAAPSLERLPELLSLLARTRNLLVHAFENAADARAPLTLLLDVATRLRGADRLPQGPSLLAVIQEARQGFEQAETEMLLQERQAEVEASRASLQRSLPGLANESTQTSLFGQPESESASSDRRNLARVALTLAERLRAWMGAVAKGLLSDVRVRVVSDIPTFAAGSSAELTVSILNEGTLPLRTFRMETEPQWGSTRVDLIPEAGAVQFTLRGKVPTAPGAFLLIFRWTARKLDGSNVTGETQLSFEVRDPTDNERVTDEQLGDNPYVTGTPLSSKYGSEMFFGREALIERITRQIVTHGNVILLEGNRRAGKTSILRHLEGKNVVRGWLAVYADLQGAEGAANVVGVPTPSVFREFAGSIAKALVTEGIDAPLPDGRVIPAGGQLLGIGKACRDGISDEAPFSDFRGYLEIVLHTLAEKGLGLLLMLDEFDKLQEGIDRGVTSPQVPDNIRFMIQTYPRCSAILTGSRRLKRLREEYWSALYGLGISVPVTALNPQDAKRVVLEPVRGRLVYSPEAVDRVLVLTACQPYLLQCLCNRIFELAASTQVRSITLNEVEKSAAGLVKDNEHFANLWDYAAQGSNLGRCRRQYVLSLCADAFRQGSDPDFNALREILAQRGVETGDEALAADLDYLRELDLIVFEGAQGNKRYRLAIPLMADWIEQQHDRTVVQSRAMTEAEEESE